MKSARNAFWITGAGGRSTQMLEFVFFHPEPRTQFVAFLARFSIAVSEWSDDEVLFVGIPEDIDDARLVQVEAHYDGLMDLDRQLAEGEVPGQQNAGVVVNLASGERVYATLDPDLLSRIMSVLSPEELGTLVDAIVDAVERPDARTLCRRAD